MKFSELHELIPLARYGKPKSLTMSPYNGITLAMPGRHAEDTSPKGGDFVVMVDDDKLDWVRHQFKHSDIFSDVQTKFDADVALTKGLMEDYLNVVAVGDDPAKLAWKRTLPGLHPQTFLYAVQCLGVAEHRRYHRYEDKHGGRFLPFRFAAGIAEGLWTAEAGSEVQKYGRPAVERLEKKNGKPVLTQKLMDTKP